MKLERYASLAHRFLCCAMESELYQIGMMWRSGDGGCVSLAEEWVRRKRGPEWGHIVVIQSLSHVPLFETP